MKNALSILLFSYLIIGVSKQNFALEIQEPLAQYLGAYVCWDVKYPKKTSSKSVDEFTDSPTLNFQMSKDRQLVCFARSMQKISGKSQEGYYCVQALNLKITPEGLISFKIGRRKIYSQPIGWNEKGRGLVGVSESESTYIGKITDDEIDLTCNGSDCVAPKMIFSRIEP